MNLFKSYIIWFGIVSSFFLMSCNDNRVFEHNYQFKNREWLIDSVPSYEIQITENQIPYNLLVNVRNEITYPYYNLFCKVELMDSTQKIIFNDMAEFHLMDSKTGKPFGSGTANLFFHQYKIKKDFKFPYNGKYRVRLTQYMRDEVLKGVHSVGFRVEKVKS